MTPRRTAPDHRRPRRAGVLAAAAIATALLLTGCIPTPPTLPGGGPPITDEEHAERLDEQWSEVDPALMDGEHSVILTFTDLPARDDAVWDEMFALELAAGEALLDAEVGYLDGNGSDGVVYEVFFFGTDQAEMWSVVEPLYADAPLPWSQAMSWDSLEATEPALHLTR